MAYIIKLQSFNDTKGNLTVGDGVLPFEIKRFYFMKDNKTTRAECMHKKSIQAILCIKGTCTVYVNNGVQENSFILETSENCLIIEQGDWHNVFDFSDDSILLVFSSGNYDKDDFYKERYK